MIYLLIVNYYSITLIAKLISSIPISQKIHYQFIIINNSPEDGEIKDLGSSIKWLEAGNNIGFGGACSLGLEWIFAQDSNALVWIINPDTYFVEEMLSRVASVFKLHPEVSILGTIVYTPTKDIWFAGGDFIPKTGSIIAREEWKEDKNFTYCDWVSGCSLLINLAKFSECPQFDPAYFLYYEDFDFCRRYASQGHLVGITNQISVVHQPSSITNRNPTQKLKHSTHSYLLTLDRYVSKPVFLMRFSRLSLNTLVLFLFKPRMAIGKLLGIKLWLESLNVIS